MLLSLALHVLPSTVCLPSRPSSNTTGFGCFAQGRATTWCDAASSDPPIRFARLTVSVPVAVLADPEADAGRVSGGRRPGQRGPALPGPRDLVRVVRAPGQACPVQVSNLGREKST